MSRALGNDAVTWSDPGALGLAPIISVGELCREIEDRGRAGALVLADVRWAPPGAHAPAPYASGHLPGAISVDVERHLTGEGAPERGRHPFPNEDDFADTLAELGIAFEDTVVAYGADDPLGAARFVLMLRLSGVRAAVLDGGLSTWVREMGEEALETEESVREAVEFDFQPFVRLVSMDEVAHAIPTRGALLVDARPAERFAGRGETLDPRPGHIPGAVNVPSSALLDEDGRLHAPARLRRLFEDAGLRRERVCFAYCGSGMAAALSVLAMDQAGFEHVYLYPGSYSEWSRDNARPVEGKCAEVEGERAE